MMLSVAITFIECFTDNRSIVTGVIDNHIDMAKQIRYVVAFSDIRCHGNSMRT